MRAPIYEPKGRAREYAPLALNLWGTCSHGCKYCYCPGALRVKPEDFHVEGPPRPGVLEALRKQLAKDADKDQPEFCGGDRRVLLSFIGDCYQPHEDGFTRQALALLVEYHVPFSVLTKGGMRAARDFDLYADGMGTFGTTLCVSDEETRKAWEPHAANIWLRVRAIEEAKAMGIYTWVSIEPVIDPIHARWLIPMMSGDLGGRVDEFRVGKLNHHPHAKTIDWAAFALDALAALQESGCAWRIKNDLYKYLPPDSPQSSGGDGE